MHAGIDIKLHKGDTIVSAFDGKVRIARTISGYGKLIVVRHNNGLETVYGHLSAYLVKVNDEVTAGQPLGLGGRTGRATTEHLHFETRVLGEHFNPERIIDFENGVLKEELLIMDKTLLGFASKKSNKGNAAVNEADAKYHKIRSGDTLYAIARKNNMTVNQLCQLNGISPKKVLRIGSQIRVQ
jgi:murein DD-endopeptidase MepM/ murein hydrolase activator NlpD